MRFGGLIISRFSRRIDKRNLESTKPGGKGARNPRQSNKAKPLVVSHFAVAGTRPASRRKVVTGCWPGLAVTMDGRHGTEPAAPSYLRLRTPVIIQNSVQMRKIADGTPPLV